MFDLVIRGGTVVDGSGRPRYRADVGVQDGRITSIGRITERGTEEVDAEGKFVAPGFIEVHTHMDAQVFWDPLGTCSSWHGVTTAVLGQLRLHAGPVRRARQEPGHAQSRAGRGHLPGGHAGGDQLAVGDLPRLSRRRRADRQGHQLRRVHGSLGAADVRDGRTGLRGAGDRRRRGHHVPPPRRGGQGRCARAVDLAHAQPPDIGRQARPQPAGGLETRCAPS